VTLLALQLILEIRKRENSGEYLGEEEKKSILEFVSF
jgi:hypothetical protein